jgi:chromatin structure-remodeling complex protein RSC7
VPTPGGVSCFSSRCSPAISDGRWVTDDYDEDAVRAECIEKGIVPGSLVGELPDLNIYPIGDIGQPIRTHAYSHLSGPSGTSGVGAGSGNLNAGGGGGSSGIYRSGGPTTHFGGAGLGPFDDPYYFGGGAGSAGAAARRAALSRDGIGEDNWMWKTALRVHESNEAFRGMRKGRLQGAAITLDPPDSDRGAIDGGIEETLRVIRDLVDETGAPIPQPDAEDPEVLARKQRRIDENAGAALGMYEPHTDSFLCEPSLLALLRGLCTYSPISSRPSRYPTDTGNDRACPWAPNGHWRQKSWRSGVGCYLGRHGVRSPL